MLTISQNWGVRKMIDSHIYGVKTTLKNLLIKKFLPKDFLTQEIFIRYIHGWDSAENMSIGNSGIFVPSHNNRFK